MSRLARIGGSQPTRWLCSLESCAATRINSYLERGLVVDALTGRR
jgi:hypothetical protein